MNWISPFFNTRAKFGLSEERIKRLTLIEMKCFRRTAGYNLFDHKKKEEIFLRVETRTSGRETKKIQIKLATTSNKNEQQHDSKNNAELLTEWAKTTWKTFDETSRRGGNRSIKR